MKRRSCPTCGTTIHDGAECENPPAPGEPEWEREWSPFYEHICARCGAEWFTLIELERW